jgi:hypothetical protein
VQRFPSGLDRNIGSHVYSALDKFDADGRRDWISTASFGHARAPDVKNLAQSVTLPPEFLEHIRSAVSDGATLVITDVRVGRQTLSKPNVNILTTD